jgi:hypothetical protein
LILRSPGSDENPTMETVVEEETSVAEPTSIGEGLTVILQTYIEESEEETPPETQEPMEGPLQQEFSIAQEQETPTETQEPMEGPLEEQISISQEQEIPIVTQEPVSGTLEDRPIDSLEINQSKPIVATQELTTSPLAETTTPQLEQTCIDIEDPMTKDQHAPSTTTNITRNWVNILHSFPIYASLVRDNRMLCMKNQKMQLDVKLLKDKLEYKKPKTKGFPAASSLATREPNIGLEEKGPTQEKAIQTLQAITLDISTQTQDEQTPTEDTGIAVELDKRTKRKRR